MATSNGVCRAPRYRAAQSRSVALGLLALACAWPLAAGCRSLRPATAGAWRISERQARDTVLAYLKRERPQLDVDRVTVVRKTTASMFGQLGRPVYEVEWVGFHSVDRSRGGGHEKGWLERSSCGVDGETGQILTKVRGQFQIHEQPRPK